MGFLTPSSMRSYDVRVPFSTMLQRMSELQTVSIIRDITAGT